LPDDLRGDTIGGDEEDFEDEEVISERTMDAVEADAPKPQLAPRSAHTRPGNGGVEASKSAVVAHTVSRITTTVPAGLAAPTISAATLSKAEKIRQARQKGYEGDPCTNCGQLTLVRSGACAKCDSCGETSGCS
jgi:ribonucleoside-diphosphate reductase alpha chain